MDRHEAKSLGRRRDGAPILAARKGSKRQSIALTPVPLLPSKAGGSYDEAWLQELLFHHPEVLPIREIEPGFADLVSVCRELPTLHGPIDNLFMTAEGDLVIVEAKLWRNPQARREAVAQALDYASCLFAMSYERFEEAVLRGSFGSAPKPSSLYALFENVPDALTEAAYGLYGFDSHQSSLPISTVSPPASEVVWKSRWAANSPTNQIRTDRSRGGLRRCRERKPQPRPRRGACSR